MNHIFNVIWSKTEHCYVVVSELVKHNGRSTTHSISKSAVLAAFVITAGAAMLPLQPAMAADGNVVIGNGFTYGTSASTGALYYSVAIGTAVANGNNSIAIGTGGFTATTTAVEAIAIGGTTEASGKYSVALGFGTAASLDNSVAVGRGSTTAAASTTNTSSAAINGTTYTFGTKGATAYSVFSVGSSNSKRQVQNVANGEVSSNSTDAINGSQLYAVANQTSTNVTNIATNKTNIATNATNIATNTTNIATNKTNIATNKTNITNLTTAVNNGWEMDVNGTKLKSVTPASNKLNIKSGSGVSIIGSGDDITISATGGTGTDTDIHATPGSYAVTGNKATIPLEDKTGASAGNVELTGIASTNDITTLNTTINTLKTDGIKVAGDTGNSTTQLGKKITVKGDGNNITTVDTADTDNGSTVTVNMSNDPVFDSVTIGETITMNADGIDMGGLGITNLADGVSSSDAVNLGQLKKVKDASVVGIKATRQNMSNTTVNYISYTTGDGSTYDLSVPFSGSDYRLVAANGISGDTSAAGHYHIKNNQLTLLVQDDIGAVTKSIIIDGIASASDVGNITNIKKDGTGDTTGDSVVSNINNLYSLTNQGLTFAGDTNTTGTSVALGNKVSIVGNGNTVTTGYSSKNVMTTEAADGTGAKVQILMSDTPNFTSATIGSVSIAGDKISNLTAGTADGDAVNVSQLNKKTAAATTEVIAGANVKSVDKTTDDKDGHTIYKVNVDNMKATGGSAAYNTDGTGTLTLTNGDGSTATVTGLKNTYTTSGALSGMKETFTRNDGTTYDVDLSGLRNGLSTTDYRLVGSGTNHDGAYTVDSTNHNVKLNVYDPSSNTTNNVEIDGIASTSDITNLNTTITSLRTDGIKVAGDTGNSTTQLGKKITVKGDGKNITTVDAADSDNGSIVTVKMSDTPTYTSAVIGGVNITGGKITKLSNGDVTATSTDAVNGSQLYKAAAAATTTLENGTNTTVSSTTNTDGSKTYKVNVNANSTFGTGDTAINVNGETGKITAGTGDNAVTIDGTSGTVTAGKVTINGTAGTVNGLTNKTWDGTNYVSGQVATEDQLKIVSDTAKAAGDLAKKHSTVTVNNGSSNGSLVLNTSTNSDGGNNYDVSLADNINVGGTNGSNGSIGVNGKDGTNGVTISANGDNDGHIGINGKDGSSADITVHDGVPGVNGADGTTMTRVVYKDKDGNTHDAATLDDGMKYSGDTGSAAVKLNQNVAVVGETASGKNLTTGNIGVEAVQDGDNAKLVVKLADDLTGLKSVTSETVNATTVNASDTVTAGNVTINGKDGTVNGLTNKTWDGTNYVTGQGATEDQLKIVSDTAKAAGDLAKKHSTVTVNNGSSNGSLVLNTSPNSDGGNNYDVSLADNINVGGTNGKDGSIGVKGKDGTNGVTISANGDNDGHIGINGKDGSSADITVHDGAPGVNGADGTTMTRVVYKDKDGNTHDAATLDDGMKYSGDTGSAAVKLNQNVAVVGETASGKNLTTGNIGVEAVQDGDNAKLVVKLADDLTGLKSVTSETVNATTVNATTIKAGDTVTINKNGIDAGGTKITNVKDGDVSEGSTDVVTGGQLYTAEVNTSNAFTTLGNAVNKLGDRVDKVGAGSAALAALHPLDFDPDDKWDFAAGYGHYKGEGAAAIGAFYRPNEDTMFSLGASFGNGENMWNTGLSVKLGQGNHISTSRVAMAKEIVALRTRNQQITDRMNAMEQKMNALMGVMDMSKSKDFPDVPANHWAYEAVAKLAGNGIIKGYPDGDFKGDRTMTRYEFAMMLYSAMKNGASVDGKLIQEFQPELARIRVDTLYPDTMKIERVRVIPQKKTK